MSLHRRRIQQHFFGRPARRGESVEYLGPYALRCPPDKAIIEGLAWAIDRRRIDPASTGFQHMDNATDDAQIVDPWLAARVGRQMRRQPCELAIAQPEEIAHCTTPAVRERES